MIAFTSSQIVTVLIATFSIYVVGLSNTSVDGIYTKVFELTVADFLFNVDESSHSLICFIDIRNSCTDL